MLGPNMLSTATSTTPAISAAVGALRRNSSATQIDANSDSRNQVGAASAFPVWYNGYRPTTYSRTPETTDAATIRPSCCQVDNPDRPVSAERTVDNTIEM